jgi:hypothetical protein
MLLIVGPSACAVSTPRCDEGNRLLDAAQLSRATETFALAAQHGEGDCAETGLAAAADRYKDAHVAVARGRAAESARDANTAAVAYQAALTFDVENAAAREALARLQQPVPLLREPDSVQPTPLAEPRSSFVVPLLFTTVGLLCVLIALLCWAVWRWRNQSADRNLSDDAIGKPLVLREVQGVDSLAVAEAPRRDDAGTSREILSVVTATRSDVDKLTASADRYATELEWQVDNLAALLAESAGSEGDATSPTLRQFVHPDADRLRADDGTGQERLDEVMVDVLLYSTANGDGTNRLVLRRTAYVEPDEGPEAAVEELWISAEHPSQASLARAVRALHPVGALLVLGRPCPAVPGMALATGSAIAATASVTAALDARIELLLLLRGQVRDLPAEPWLAAAELSAAATSVGRVARGLILGVISDLRLRPDESSQDSDTDVPRQALSGDLDDARTRLGQQELWERIEGGRLTLAWTQAWPANTTPEEVWSRWERQTSDGAVIRGDDVAMHADGDAMPALDSIAAIFIGVDGGQVGEHNKQVNLFRYRLEPTIDLRTVLERAQVRSALAEFAVSRGDPAAREEAIKAIQSMRTSVRTDWGRGDGRVDSLQGAAHGSVSTLAGTVVLCDCRGIQVGNHLRQYNTFAFVLAPTLDVHKLFAEHPDVVETIVDYACGGDGLTHRTVQDRLAEAVQGSAGMVLERTRGSAQHDFGGMVRNDVGQSVGRDIRQSDVVDLVALVSDTTVRAVDSARIRAAAARDEAARMEAAARAEEAHDAAWPDMEIRVEDREEDMDVRSHDER